MNTMPRDASAISDVFWLQSFVGRLRDYLEAAIS